MERDKMMEMPVRSLSMRERIEDLCTVDLRKIETCGQRPGVEELLDGRHRAYVYTDPVKSFDVYVAASCAARTSIRPLSTTWTCVERLASVSSLSAIRRWSPVD